MLQHRRDREPRRWVADVWGLLFSVVIMLAVLVLLTLVITFMLVVG